MRDNKPGRLWLLITALLVIIIIIAGISIWLRYDPGDPISVSAPRDRQWQGTIFIEGAVTVPGNYPFNTTDSIASLIRAAGGTNSTSNLSELRLYIPSTEQVRAPQRVNINTAEAWLLEALPKIGSVLAQRIIDYRQQNGPFLNTLDITKVAGVDSTTYEAIKSLITVAE